MLSSILGDNSNKIPTENPTSLVLHFILTLCTVPLEYSKGFSKDS